MREVRRSAIVPYSPAQMYALVNDVARYPEFLPWCPATRIHAETAESITATVDLERAGLRIGLTTRNTMVPGERIEMTFDNGPLKHFDGRWLFVPIRPLDAPEQVAGCRVELEVNFEFKSAALGLVLGPLFEATWDSIVGAFVRRAREVYRVAG